MERIFKVFFFTLSLVFCITLEEAEELALRNFYEIKEKKEIINQSQEDIYKTYGEFLPKINFSYSYFFAKKQSINFNTPFFSTQFTLINDNFYRANLIITQDIINPVAFKKLNLAKSSKELRTLELEIVKNAIRYKVRETYLNALKLKATIKILKKQIKRLIEHYKNVKALYEEGYIAYKDLLETKVKLYEVKNKLKEAESDYRKSLDLLSFLTTTHINDVKDIKDFTLPKIISIHENPKLKALKTHLKLSKIQKDLVSSYFYPFMDFSFLYQRTNESSSLPKNRYFVSLNLKWNIFNGGKKIFELRKAKEGIKIANLKYLKERNLLKTELKGILRDIRVIKEEIETAKLRLQEAREHYKLAVEKYKNGLGTNAEVLDAEAYLTSAEQELKIKEYDLILAKFKLLEVIGR